MADKWRLEGTLFDACNCTTLCPCNYFQNPTGSDCRATAVWHVQEGNLGKTKLDGLNIANVIFSNGNPLFGIDRGAFIVDSKATPAQRKAFGTILSGEAGGLFGLLKSIMKTPPEIVYAKFSYKNNGRTWSVTADGFRPMYKVPGPEGAVSYETLNLLDVQGGFVKPPPQAPVKAAPKKAQTYDALYGPTMEKVVGISDHYRANVAGMDYDIQGKYSSSGRFAYKGP